MRHALGPDLSAGDALGFRGHRFPDSLLLTFWFVFLTAGPAVFFLLFVHLPSAWLWSRVGVAVCGLTFFELMIGSWLPRGQYRREDERWLGAAGATAFYGLLIVACLAGAIEQRPWRWPESWSLSWPGAW